MLFDAIKMVKIASYVFFDLETTGLPHQERNQTKIIELSFIAALREDLERAVIGSRPFISKLSLLLNPQRKIHPEVIKLTGLNNEMLKNAPIFKDKVETILSFLKELPKPVCLVAHNGNIFDFKIFLAEFTDVNASLPNDLFCVDSLVGFRKMHKEQWPQVSSHSSFEDSRGSEDWPDLNITPEDWNEIDVLCSSLTDVGFTESASNKSVNKNKANEKITFKLTDIYKRFLNKEVINAHRAEDDCMMLLECVVAAKEFLIWTDKYCKPLSNIKPLQRYW